MNTDARPLRIIFAGVGGQGVLTAARLLGDAALESDLPVRVGQLHDMAQRGGSVESLVVIGPGHTSYVGENQAHIVVGFEPLEALRVLPRMCPGATVLLNRGRVVPFAMTARSIAYPEMEEVIDQLRKVTDQILSFDASALAHQAGDTRTLNMVMLGSLCGHCRLPVAPQVLSGLIESKSPQAARQANLRAFELGMAIADRAEESRA